MLSLGPALPCPALEFHSAPSAVMPWQVLRKHFKSNLPVEVMWQGPREMDDATWAFISGKFAPIRGIDITKTPHPVPGLLRP